MLLRTSSAPAGENAEAFQDDIRRLIAAMAIVLRETVAAFEDTVARVTEMTVLRQGGGADRDLVVALQEFDKLQQEFATVSDILLRLSAPPHEEGLPSSAELLPAIAIAGLRDRLARQLSDKEDDDLKLAPLPGDVEF
jgi:hypothetical protein